MATKLLYVEDEIFLGKIVQETLASKGYIVHMVSDGAEVMAAFHSFQPDICVLDVMLPHKSGLELAAEIRALDPVLPILFLTAKTQTEDLVKGFQQGGDDYIRKPFSMEELMVRMEYALGKKQQKPANPKPAQELIMGRPKSFPTEKPSCCCIAGKTATI
jgi:two-component system, OmpR family, response regulator VicR